MKILSLDTSSKFLSIAVCEDNKVLGEFHKEVGRKHSSCVIEYVSKILNKFSIDIKDIDLFVVNLGPGSFTGLRIGITAIKTASSITNKPVVGVPSLDVIASGINDNSKIKCVILDARRGNIYTGIYKDSYNKPIARDLFNNIDDVLGYISEDVVFVGDGIDLYKDDIKKKVNVGVEFLDSSFWYPRATNLAKLGLIKFKSQGADDTNSLAPMYFYSSHCQIKGKQ